MPKSSAAVAITITALLASGLVGCAADATDEVDYAQVCKDASGKRLPDKDCEEDERSGGSGARAGRVGWYFLPLGSSGRSVPPVGSNVTAPDGTTALPAGKTASKGVSTAGGHVSRGGFGGSAKAGS